MGRKITKKKVSRARTAPRMTAIRLTILEGEDFYRTGARRIGTSKAVMRYSRKHCLKLLRDKEAREAKSEESMDEPKKSKKISKVSHSAPKKRGLPKPPPVHVPSTNNNMMDTEEKKITKFNTNNRDDLAIPSFGFIDVCFCLDATGSMGGEIAEVKNIIESIIQNIENKVRTEGLQLRFAIVSYRDHPPQDHSYVTKIKDFTDNYDAVEYMKSIDAGGGGDEPQAVHDGLYDCATKLRWAEVSGVPVLRYIFHIADAPPHGKQFLNYQTKEGCLCGRQTNDVLNEINKKQIHYRLIKVRTNNKVDQMEKIFKSQLMDFDSTTIKNARQMNVKVSDMIICQVLPDYA